MSDPALARLFPTGVRIASGDPRLHWPEVLPEEASALDPMVPERRQEFRAGRALAREAMAALGVPALPVPAGSDRAPLWPPGLVGSISHCADLCAVALARAADGIVALGLDIEPAEPLPADLVAEICTREEIDALAGSPDAAILARAVFSAKECAYKVQYPLTATLLDFTDMIVQLAPVEGRFTARFAIDVPPFRAGDALEGRVSIGPRHILTGLVLRGRDRPERPR